MQGKHSAVVCVEWSADTAAPLADSSTRMPNRSRTRLLAAPQHATCCTHSLGTSHASPPRSNNLTAVPDELSEFAHLRTLRLKYNQLRKLPPVVAQLPALTVLELAGNQIGKLDPGIISAMVCLRELDLSGNQLLELPAAICRLPKLEALFLENNRRVWGARGCGTDRAVATCAHMRRARCALYAMQAGPVRTARSCGARSAANALQLV
jgi:hypothetical protein